MCSLQYMRMDIETETRSIKSGQARLVEFGHNCATRYPVPKIGNALNNWHRRLQSQPFV